MKAKFKYEDKELTIQFNKEETAGEVFTHFVNKTFLNINDLQFKYDNKLLTLDSTLISQINIPEEQNEIEILAVKKGANNENNEHYINVNIDGVEKKLVINKGEGVFESVTHFLKKRTKTLLLFYNGNYLDEKHKKKTFNEIANRDSKERNTMSVVAIDKVDNENNERLLEDSRDNEENQIIKNENEKKEEDKKENKPVIDSEEELWIARIFFIKFYLFLLIQIIALGLISFLGFYIGIEKIFSIKWVYWLIFSIVTLFAMFLAIGTIGMKPEEENKEKKCLYFLSVIYVPIIYIYILLLRQYNGNEIIEGKYFIYQIIIIAFDFLISILYNLVFPTYRGWLNAIFLIAINFLIMIIYCFPISETYEDLKISNNGLIGLSIISLVVIISLIMFNFEILDKENFKPLHFALVYNYIPFYFLFVFLVYIGVMIFFLLSFIFYVFSMILLGIFIQN